MKGAACAVSLQPQWRGVALKDDTLQTRNSSSLGPAGASPSRRLCIRRMTEA